MPAERGSGVSLEGRVRQIAHQFSSPGRSRSPSERRRQPLALATARAPNSSTVVASSPITPAAKHPLPQTLASGRSSERTARERGSSLLSELNATKVDDEKENLQKANDKLAEALRRKDQQHQRDLEELRALRESDTKLRQELDKTGGKNSKASEPIVFQSRAIVKNAFNIHNWDKECQGLSVPIDRAGHLVAAAAGGASSEITTALALVTSEHHPSQLSASRPVDEPTFADVEDEQDAEFLEQAQRNLLLGDVDAATTALGGLLIRCTRCSEDDRGYHERKYLSFSWSFKLLLDRVRAPESTNDVAVATLTNSAIILKRLASEAQFGKEPPASRPQELSRLLYVRALCAQIGLSLDIARVGFVERREQKSGAVVDGAGDAKQENQHGSPSRDRSRSRDVAAPRPQYSLPKVELELLLKRAGKYLLAVQMDMDRLHDEAEDRIEEAKKKRAAVQLEFDSATPASSEVAEEPHASFVADTLMDTLSEPSATLDLALTDGEHASDPSASQAGAIASASADTLMEPDDEASVADSGGEAHSARPLAERSADKDVEEPPPSFGDFLVKDLMPLYIKDVPFSNLRVLAEKYCGLSLDSDDEDRVWRAAGRIDGRPKVRVARRRPQRRSAAGLEKPGQAAAGTAGVSADAMAAPEAAKALFSQQVHAVQKPKTGLLTSSGSKTRFLTSVVQKDNKTGLSAIPGSMAIKIPKPSKGRTDAAAMRLLLLNSPAPNSVRKAPAQSPISMRGGMMANTPRTPVPRGSQASWGVMDATPVHQKRD